MPMQKNISNHYVFNCTSTKSFVIMENMVLFAVCLLFSILSVVDSIFQLNVQQRLYVIQV